MRNVSYFPPYSLEENVVTNAVLLLLSHVHRLAPAIFSDLITAITDVEYDVGPTFQNQVKISGGVGIPDALIRQAPFEIYIETKRGNRIEISQIKAHLTTIEKYKEVPGPSILIGLTSSPIDLALSEELKAECKKNNVKFCETTFSEIANILENSSEDFRIDLNLLLEEFRAFIQERGLVPPSENRLLINPCGTSYDQNKDHDIYYDNPSRSKVFCKYLGIYKDKSVSLIGEVLAVVSARIDGDEISITENHPLSWRGDNLHKLTPEEEGRIKGIVKDSHYYNLRGHETRYYIVDKFVETNFKKMSKHGIQGHRYFVLDNQDAATDGVIPQVFERGKPSIEEISEALAQNTWT